MVMFQIAANGDDSSRLAREQTFSAAVHSGEAQVAAGNEAI
jgi:hypothetical protein